MQLISSLKDIRPAIRPKLKYVQFRVYINGKQEQFHTKVRVTEINPKYMDVTEKPLQYFARALYGCSRGSYTARELRTAYKLALELELNHAIDYDTSDFEKICDMFRAKFHNQYSEGYLRQFNTLVSVIRTFRPNRITTIQDITTDFINRFTNHSIDRGIVNGTTKKYLTNMKTILKFARDSLNIKISFPEFPSPKMLKDTAHVIIFLNKLELQMLEKVETRSNIEYLTLKFFLFMCYTGMRYSDLEYVSINGFDGENLQIYNAKADRSHTVRVVDSKPLNILNEFREFDSPSQQKMNYHIKKLCKRAGIDTLTTTYKSIGPGKPLVEINPKHEIIEVHSSRRTWASLTYKHTNNNIVLVSKKIGHTRIKTTLGYIGHSGEDESKMDGQFD